MERGETFPHPRLRASIIEFPLPRLRGRATWGSTARILLLALVLSSCYIPIRPGKAPATINPDTVRDRHIAGAPPPGSIILFDGNGLSEWTDRKGGPARWRATPTYMEIVPRTGSIRTRRRFGDVQLHLEWATPSPPRGSGQSRGNSGVYLMGRYEVQILDSYRNRTYAKGQAAAIYGQTPPRVNASRPPGQWQTYDILFHAPRFTPQGVVPARLTLYHNGVLVHDNVVLRGRTGRLFPRYSVHPDRLPLVLQDHGSRLRFRNIWIHPLSPENE